MISMSEANQSLTEVSWLDIMISNALFKVEEIPKNSSNRTKLKSMTQKRFNGDDCKVFIPLWWLGRSYGPNHEGTVWDVFMLQVLRDEGLWISTLICHVCTQGRSLLGGERGALYHRTRVFLDFNCCRPG